MTTPPTSATLGQTMHALCLLIHQVGISPKEVERVMVRATDAAIDKREQLVLGVARFALAAAMSCTIEGHTGSSTIGGEAQAIADDLIAAMASYASDERDG